MKKKRILFMAHHRLGRSPGQRFRFEQYIPFLESNGFEVVPAPLLTKEQDRILYSSGNYAEKALLLVNTYFKRQKDVKSVKDFDLIFLYREAFTVGGAFFEKKLKESGVPLITDFDDAVWLPNISEGNKYLAFLKKTEKAHDIFQYSNVLIAGNSYLAEYARSFNKNVFIIPTTVDTDLYKPFPARKDNEKIVIGWSGSPTTVAHFETLIPVLKKIKERYGDKIIFRLIGDATRSFPELGIQGIAWTPERELETINSFDIGIMPLPNDRWSEGKCGLKGLTYMSFEKAAILSSVGVNREIITDGVNGFLADNEEEWLEKLSLLIENSELRLKLGKAGRAIVEEKYSVRANQNKYLKVIQFALASSAR